MALIYHISVNEPTPHKGGCHCGKVRFSVVIQQRRALICNCSICTVKGFIHLIVPAGDFELLQGESELTSYRFNTGIANHLFCRHCGVQSYYVPRSHPTGFSVNLRCIDDLCLDDFELSEFDGANWEEKVEEIR
jgi:hypothetical protein